jgi:NDP-sugar pyrophosphorylase family protein
MNAMILAAGRGTRLGTLGVSTPKVLIDLGGEPLLARHLRYLEREGVQRVVINTYHLAEHIQGFISRYSGRLELVCVVEDQLLGTAGGVRNALRELRPGPFIVLYGDVLIDESLAGAVETHRRRHATATLAVHPAPAVEGKGVVELGDDGRVIAFVEKPVASRGSQAWINSGIYVLDDGFIAQLPEGQELDFGNDVFPDALARGAEIFAHRLSTAVLDIGTPGGLEQARARVAAERRQ